MDEPLIPKPTIESWVKHQDKVKWLLYILGALMGLLMFNHYLPAITDFVDGVITLTQALFVLAVSLTVLFTFLYAAKKVSRGVIIFLDNLELRSEMAAIKADPFGTAQNAINKSRQKLKAMGEHVMNLRGSIERLKDKIKQFLEKASAQISKGKLADKNKRAAEAAHNPGGVKKYTTFLNSAARMRAEYEASANRLRPNLKRAETLYGFLVEFQQYSEAQIKDAQELLELRKDEFDINRDSQEAVQAAVNALDGSQKRLLDMAMLEIHTQIYTMVGEIEHVMQMTQPILEMNRFEDEVQLQSALDSFQEYLGTDTALPAAQKNRMMITAGESVPVDEFMTADEQELVPVSRGGVSKYDVR